jgi:hypothetical protein
VHGFVEVGLQKTDEMRENAALGYGSRVTRMSGLTWWDVVGISVIFRLKKAGRVVHPKQLQQACDYRWM